MAKTARAEVIHARDSLEKAMPRYEHGLAQPAVLSSLHPALSLWRRVR